MNERPSSDRPTARPRFLQIAKRHGIVPAKRLGQHFLVNEGVLEKIVNAAAPRPDETVVEVGPGIGNLTWHVAGRAGAVVAIEKDARLRPVLEESLADRANVRVVFADALAVDPVAVARDAGLPGPTALVANLPYNVAATVLLRYLSECPSIERAVVMVQKEVADRICAAPGTPAYSGLTVKFRALGDARALFTVSPGSFWPPPDVTSAVVAFRREPRVSRLAELFELVDAAFGQRRKTVLNSLAGSGFRGLDREAWRGLLAAAGIPETVRPERLDWHDFARLLEALARPSR